MRIAAALVFSVLVVGCATPAAYGAQELSSAEVWEHHHELDGRTIEVRGWLQYCESLGCRIADSREDRDPGLSIASSVPFDRAVYGLIGREILISGRLNSDCLHTFVDSPKVDRSQIICTDRANMIEKPRLIKVY